MIHKRNIAVVGAGLVGTLLSIYLKKMGHRVTVYDRRPDIRKTQFSGRSINLAMSVRGWKALEGVGIAKAIRKIAIPMYRRAIHVKDTPLYYQDYGTKQEAIYSLSRGLLNKQMIQIAAMEGVHFFFTQKIWDIDLPKGIIYTGKSENDIWKSHKYDTVFGADGAFSRVRHKMQRQSHFNYWQEFSKYGYKELTIPARADGTHQLDKNALHIWPRGSFMFVALPNPDGSFTGTLFMPFKGTPSFEQLNDENKLFEFFTKVFPDIPNLMPELTTEFFKNPLSTLVTVKCYPWTYRDTTALVGDACHAILPFLGQGMNAGFEDITVLSALLKNYDDDWETAFKNYQKMRKPNTDAIEELSYQNFIEMRDKTADPDFILRKKIEQRFATKHPDKWTPLYSKISFSHCPYAKALESGNRQKSILDNVMKIPDISQCWKSRTVENFIISELERNKRPSGD